MLWTFEAGLLQYKYIGILCKSTDDTLYTLVTTLSGAVKPIPRYQLPSFLYDIVIPSTFHIWQLYFVDIDADQRNKRMEI